MLSNKEIGQRIRDIRLSKGLRAEDVANRVGLTVSTVTRYELGQIQRMKLPVIHAIANALEVDPAWLIAGESDDVHSASDSTFDADLVRAYHDAPEHIQQAIRSMLQL